MRTPLRRAVELASWASLLPPHRADGDDQPAGAPRYLDALDLAPGRWLTLVADAAGRTYPVPLVAAGSGVRRARAGDGAAEALAGLLGGGSREVGAFVLTSWHAEPVTGEAAIDVDQTNESVVLGGRGVVKWTFQATEGPHPAPAILELLERAGFTGTPRPWGLVQWLPSRAAAPRLVASVTAYLPGAVDGWTWAVEDLRRACTDGPDAVRTPGRRLGELVAHFHLALLPTRRPADAADVARWHTEARADLRRALEATTGAEHAQLARHRDEIAAGAVPPPELAGTPMLLGHGDLHVGQVLRAGESYAVIDFDGNPVVPPAQRTRAQPPALDVAGMTQSIRHAGLVLRKHHPDLDPARVERMTGEFVQAFLDAYRATLAAAGRADLLEEALLRPFRLRQVCREFTYAATHLPRWAYVPAGALPELVEGAR
ncbi:aminoglycoside phosphotransferase [Georgenia ruanii]|uniref:aminoglycoside phosphotransferase n=1 Tax=Georgenia ruanii TaxID=348442 RepID=UPI0012649C8D|nr:aminoglycoside phosphotransferase [Georgenia ruanii]